MEEITIYTPDGISKSKQQDIIEICEHEDFDDIHITFDTIKGNELVIECEEQLLGDFLHSHFACLNVLLSFK